jgi:hypothetical protein
MIEDLQGIDLQILVTAFSFSVELSFHPTNHTHFVFGNMEEKSCVEKRNEGPLTHDNK